MVSFKQFMRYVTTVYMCFILVGFGIWLQQNTTESHPISAWDLAGACVAACIMSWLYREKENDTKPKKDDKSSPYSKDNPWGEK